MNNEEMHAAEVAGFQRDIAYLQKTFDAHEMKDLERQRDIAQRLLRLELAIATALGGLVVLGWLANRLADNIIGMISKIQ